MIKYSNLSFGLILLLTPFIQQGRVNANNYLGCFKDDLKNRDLPLTTFVTPKQGLTIDNCIDFCKSNNHSVAGLQNGKEW